MMTPAGRRRAKKYRATSKGKLMQKRSALKYRYRLTPYQIEAALLARRGMFCQTCGQLAPLVVDHDHASGRFRGFLCAPCNSALGHAKDSAAILRRLANYLESAFAPPALPALPNSQEAP